MGLCLRRGWSGRWLHTRKWLWPEGRGQCLVRAATEWAASLVPVGSLGHVPLLPKGINTCNARGDLKSSRAWGLRSHLRLPADPQPSSRHRREATYLTQIQPCHRLRAEPRPARWDRRSCPLSPGVLS